MTVVACGDTGKVLAMIEGRTKGLLPGSSATKEPGGARRWR